MIISNFLWHRVVRKFSFKGMLIISVLLLCFLPLLTLAINYFNNIKLFYLLFLFAGSAISAQKNALDGVLVEISNEENRPLYTGIFVVLNITSALVSLFMGFIFDKIGYSVPFILISLITLSTLIFIREMICPIDIEKDKYNNA